MLRPLCPWVPLAQAGTLRPLLPTPPTPSPAPWAHGLYPPGLSPLPRPGARFLPHLWPWRSLWSLESVRLQGHCSQLWAGPSKRLPLPTASVLLCAKSLQSCLTPCHPPTPLGTAAHQAPLSMGFSRQEYWSGLPLLQGIFLTRGSNLRLLCLLH